MIATDWKPVDSPAPCRKCGEVGHLEVSVWTDDRGEFEDKNYHCNACGNEWWIEGADA